MRSSSLKEFWGKRWDTVLQSLLKEYVYKPLRKNYGASHTMAGFITFFCSGLGHTLPISNGLGDLNMMFAMLLYFLVEFILLCVQDSLSRTNEYMSGNIKSVAWAITLFLVLAPAPLFLIPALCLSQWCPQIDNYNYIGLGVLYTYEFWCIYTVMTMLLICIVGVVRHVGYISSHAIEQGHSSKLSLYAYAMFSAFGIGNFVASFLIFFLGEKILKNSKSRETFMPKLTNTVEVFQLSIFCMSVLYLIGFGGIGMVVDDDDGGKQAGRSRSRKGKKRS